jgi:hypothetical protein
MIKIHVHSRNNTLALTLRVIQKHIIHPHKILHSSVTTLSKVYLWQKKIWAMEKNPCQKARAKIHAKKHERKKTRREIAHIFKTEAMGESHVKRSSN